MSYSRNLDDRLRRRLTTIFVTEVKKLGPGTYPLFNLADVQGETYLPQVSLFDNRAAAWLLPQLKVSAESVVYAYEVFVEQSLGTTPHPGKAAEDALKTCGARGMTKVFDLSRDPRHWFTPAVRLLAYASLCEGAEVFVDTETNVFIVDVDGAHLEVSPQGVYSNAKGELVKPALEPTDTETADMRLPGTTSTSKIIAALDEMLQRKRKDFGEHLRILSAMFEHRVANPTQFVKAFKEPDPVAFVPLVSEAKRKKAANEAEQVLFHCDFCVMPKLYAALVPTLFTSREFAASFGSTAAKFNNRQIRERTRQEWAERIRARAA